MASSVSRARRDSAANKARRVRVNRASAANAARRGQQGEGQGSQGDGDGLGGLGDRQRELRDMLGKLQRGMREFGLNAPEQFGGADEVHGTR